MFDVWSDAVSLVCSEIWCMWPSRCHIYWKSSLTPLMDKAVGVLCIFLLSTNLTKSHLFTSIVLFCVLPDTSSSSVPQRSIVVQKKRLETHEWVTLLLCVTRFFIISYSLFRLTQILTRAPNLDTSAGENSPQQIHCSLLHSDQLFSFLWLKVHICWVFLRVSVRAGGLMMP